MIEKSPFNMFKLITNRQTSETMIYVSAVVIYYCSNHGDSSHVAHYTEAGLKHSFTFSVKTEFC